MLAQAQIAQTLMEYKIRIEDEARKKRETRKKRPSKQLYWTYACNSNGKLRKFTHIQPKYSHSVAVAAAAGGDGNDGNK